MAAASGACIYRLELAGQGLTETRTMSLVR